MFFCRQLQVFCVGVICGVILWMCLDEFKMHLLWLLMICLVLFMQL